jgi:DNA replication and repair protein RecF
VELPRAGVVLVGPNGHGKTSFLEALLYPEVFRSFRGALDREIVRFGDDGFHVAVETTEAKTRSEGNREVVGRQRGRRSPADSARGRVVAAGYDARTREKRVTVDGAVTARLADAIGMVRGVVLSPDDVQLVSGGAKERRRYLDLTLSLSAPGYLESLGEYRRALRHRCRATPSDMADWEAMLARSGARVAALRRTWAEAWATRYGEHCERLGEAPAGAAAPGRPERRGPQLCYVSRGTEGEAELAGALARSREKDVARQTTSVGPHRDDLRLLLGGREVRVYGSAGQWRTAAMALRLVQAETLAARDGGRLPALCLDDAFAELDAGRSAKLGRLVEELAERGSQVFATVPREGDIPDAVRRLPRWRMMDGRLEASEGGTA